LERVSFTTQTSEETPIASVTVTADLSPAVSAGFSGEQMRALAKMLQRLGRSVDVKETLAELLAGLFAIFAQAQRGYVAFTGDEDDVTPRATHFHRGEVNPRVGISRTIVRHVLSRKEAVLWAESDASEELSAFTLKELQIRSLMCAPLLDGDGRPFGVVQIDTDQPLQAFTAEDLEVMVGAVSQAAVAIRFAKLHEEALRRQAVQRDLELARSVQLGLLPVGYPTCEGIEFFAYYQAAYEVGGDYYDFIELPNDRLALVVADAAGKGVSAALTMAKLSGELKYYLSFEPPGAALTRMNESLCHSDSGRFVTLLVVIQDRRSPALTIVNAGHPAPLRRRPTGIVDLVGEAARGAALGLLPGQQYQEVRSTVEPGEVWFMYTDGFTEAINSRDEMFGAARLRERLAQNPAGVRQAGEQLVAAVRSFQGDQPQSDDMCLLGWGRTGGTSLDKTSAARANHNLPTQALPGNRPRDSYGLSGQGVK
jgi:serine phosphatase RsbU (regulator of sigma subunit)